MPDQHARHAWPGRRWPVSVDEEHVFVSELTAAAGRRPSQRWSRADLTACLTALRAGCTLTEVLEWAPGASPSAMLAAYRHLDARRMEAIEAWGHICAAPGTDVLVVHGTLAYRLLPVPVQTVLNAIEQLAERPAAFSRVVRRTAAEVRHMTAAGQKVSARLAVTTDSRHAVDLGRRLFDPVASCVWAEPYFAAERVGELSPVRVADLLDESRIAPAAS